MVSALGHYSEPTLANEAVLYADRNFVLTSIRKCSKLHTRPRGESNSHLLIRSQRFYPLYYKAIPLEDQYEYNDN